MTSEINPTEGVSKSTLEKIVDLANKQVQLERDLEEHAKKGKLLSEQLEVVRGGFRFEGQLPAAMLEAGLEEIRLSSGELVCVKKELKAPSLAAGAENRDKVLEWVEASGHGDLIKDEIKIPFAKGDARVQKILDALVELKLQFDRYRTIHSSTFGAFLRELLEKGAEIPMDELGIKEYRQSKVS